jgi:septum formation protein
MNPLILASSSPRRAHYLRQLGFRFREDHPQVNERPRSGESPRVYVRRLALDKARQISTRRPGAWVIAADTTVVIDDKILGKPRHDREARRMLRCLSGRWHRVMTGMALTCKARRTELASVSLTRVLFRELTQEEIHWYVATKEPSDKAGAYAIQGKGGLFVERIVGSPSNVVGFPLETFYHLLLQAGLGLPH